MKTLTTTLAIFALLFSSTVFSADSNNEITSNLNLEVITSSKSDINPPIRNDKPGMEIKNNINEDIMPPLMPRKPDPVINN